MPSPRRVLRAAAILVGVVLLLLLATVAVLQIPAAATWAARRLTGLAPLREGYSIAIARATGSWLTGLRLQGVSLRHGARTLVRAESLRLSYDPTELLGSPIRLGSVDVEGLHVTARRLDGGWDIAQALRTSSDTAGGGAGFVIERLRVRDAALALQLAPDSVIRVRDLVLTADHLVLGDRVLVGLDTLRATVIAPGDAIAVQVVARGALERDVIRLNPIRLESSRSTVVARGVIPRSLEDERAVGALEATVRASPLALADVAAFFPSVVPEGELQLEAAASAERRMATATLAARLDQAGVQLDGATLLGGDGPALYRISGELAGIRPARVLRTAPEGTLSGRIDVDLRGESLDSVDGTAALHLADSRVGTTGIDSLGLTSRFEAGRARLELRADLSPSLVTAEGWARPFDSVPSYRLAGLARRLPGGGAVAEALAGRGGDPALSVRYIVEGEGASLEAADLSGRVRFAAVRSGGERVDLGRATISLSDGLLRARPVLLLAGGQVSGRVSARLGDTIRYQVREGTITGVDLARIVGDSAAAPVSGRFALEGSGTSPGTAAATGWVSLDQLRYGGRRLTDVDARARLRGGRASVELDAAVSGGALALDATAQPFDSVTSFAIDSASLRGADLGALLGRPDLAGAVSLHATAEGRWGAGTREVRGQLVMAPTRAAGLEVAGGTVTAALDQERLDYDLALTTDGGALAMAGEARPLDETPSLRVERGRLDSLDLGAILGRDDLTTSIDAGFTASVRGTALDSMLARLELQLAPSSVNQAELGPGTVDVALENGRVAGDVSLDGPDAHLAADLFGDVTGDVRQVGAEGTFRVERLARWTGDSTLQGRVEGRFALEAGLDGEGLLTAGGTLAALGGMGGVRLHQLYAVLQPVPGALVLDTLVVRSNVAVVDAGGRLALRDTAGGDTLRLVTRTGDLNPLAALAGIDTLSLDSARAVLRIWGPPRRRTVRAEASAYRLLYSNALAESLSLDAATVVDSAGIGAAAGIVEVQGLAAGPVTLRRARLAGRYDSLITVQGNADASEEVGLRFALDGETRGDTTSLLLRRVDLREGGRVWSLAQPAPVMLRPDAFVVDDFALRTAGRRVALDGVLAFRDTSDLTLSVDSLELGALEEAGLAPIPGRLQGTIRLAGPPESPRIDGRLALTLHQDDGQDPGRLQAGLVWNRRSLQVDAAAEPRAGGPLTVRGVLPWGFTLAPDDTSETFAVVREPGDTLRLAVEADSFALSLLEPLLPEETVQRLRGDLAIDALVRGTPEEPEAEGDLRIAGLGFRLPAVEVDYEQGSLRGTLQGRNLLLDTLLLTTDEDEELAAQGRIRLEPLTDPAFDITAELREFTIANSPTLQAEASGEVRLAGTLEAPVVAGSLRMGKTELSAGGSGGGGLAVEEVELTPEDRRELARHFGPAALTGPGEDEFLERFRLDLLLELPGQVWFRRRQSPELDVEVRGRIRLRQQPGEEMAFFGTVEPLPGRSRIDVYGRTFDLTGGTITLQGPVEDTRLEVNAEYHVPTQGGPDDAGVIINVAATGRPDSMELEFSSEPDMPQEDMLSYVATGRPSSDNPLVDRDGEGGGGGSLALGQLTEALSSAVSRELGFDTFQIRQDGTQGLTLTAGRYVTPYLFLSLQQPLETGGEGDERPGTGLGPGFEVQYRVQPWLRAALQGGSLPMGLRFRGRYAY